MLEIAGVDGINPAEHHRMNFLETRKRLPGRVALIGDGVTDFNIGDSFDVRDKITDVTRLQSRLDEHFWREHTYFLDVVATVIAHHPDRLIGLHLSRYHPHVTDDAAINVEYRIEHQRAQGCVGRFFRRRNPVDDRLQYFIDSDSHLRA